MFALSFIFVSYYVHLVSPLHVTGGLFGYVFGLQKICFCRCGIAQRYLPENVRFARLLGGETTSPHQFPWLAAVNVGSMIVSGSLISERHVITAASPFYGKSSIDITVTLGSHDRCENGTTGLNSSVSSLIIHPGFSPSNKDNDIALLKLRHAVPFSRFIAPICLPVNGIPESGRVAWTVAWAEGSSNATCTPRSATLPVLPSRSCVKGGGDLRFVTPDKGCLGPIGTRSIICDSDVGAPIMQRYPGFSFRLIGVVSTSSCEQVSTPLFTRVVDHIAWIYRHTHNDCQCI